MSFEVTRCGGEEESFIPNRNSTLAIQPVTFIMVKLLVNHMNLTNLAKQKTAIHF